MLKIRPHHILCLYGWRGRGYDDAFTENFNKILDILCRGAEKEVQLVGGADEICRFCPNLKEEKCGLEADGRLSAGAIDMRLKERLELEVGKKYGVSDLFGRVATELEPSELNLICQGCSWLERGWCVDGLTRGILPGAPGTEQKQVLDNPQA